MYVGVAGFAFKCNIYKYFLTLPLIFIEIIILINDFYFAIF